MKVAIIGAAGAIGKASAAALMARGDTVRVVGRDASKLAGFGAAEVVSADVATPEGCSRAVAGMDAVVYSLGLPYTQRDFARYPSMMRSCLDAARQAGVRRFLLITNVYPYGRPQPPATRVREDHPRVPCSVKGEYRKQQEDLVLAERGDGLRGISLRLPNFYGPDAQLSLAHGIFEAAKKNGTANMLAPIDTPQEFVFTPDVGPVVAELLAHPDAEGAYNFAGPGDLTHRQFAERVFRAAGHPKAKFRAAGPTLLAVAGLFSSVMRELREMSYLQETPILLDDARLRALLPRLAKTSYDDGIRATLGAAAR